MKRIALYEWMKDPERALVPWRGVIYLFTQAVMTDTGG